MADALEMPLHVKKGIVIKWLALQIRQKKMNACGQSNTFTYIYLLSQAKKKRSCKIY